LFHSALINVRFWHLADNPTVAANVRYWTKADKAEGQTTETYLGRGSRRPSEPTVGLSNDHCAELYDKINYSRSSKYNGRPKNNDEPFGQNYRRCHADWLPDALFATHAHDLR
jgi:hypothetical protein